jgi:hypothetical protein
VVLVLGVEDVTLGLKQNEQKQILEGFIKEKVEVNIGDRSIEGVITDINGVWVKLKGKLASKEGEYEFLVPIYSIKYVRKASTP